MDHLPTWAGDREASLYFSRRENESECERKRLFWVPGLDLYCSHFTRGIKTQKASLGSPLPPILLPTAAQGGVTIYPSYLSLWSCDGEACRAGESDMLPGLELKLSALCNLIWLLSHPPSLCGWVIPAQMLVVVSQGDEEPSVSYVDVLLMSVPRTCHLERH